MKYYSLNHSVPKVSFSEAVIRGLAPDRGLYFPERIDPLPQAFFETLEDQSHVDIAKAAIEPFVGEEIPAEELESILEHVLDFDFPIVPINDRMATLELFHGPTMAFKDVGARFMARCLGHFNKKNKKQITVLVATSGDTGGAVANGFLNVEGIDVVILYPKGKVSDIQERQLTTLGRNIQALRVDGVFDDCQDMVKTAFLDSNLTDHIQLTSANSINVARWLPQLFYYLFAYRQVRRYDKKIVFSVPSGNFGNICAGIVANRLGLPVHHFVAAVNSNDTIPQYLNTGTYKPKPSIPTISNAMDVGNPSNFIRIQQLYGNVLDQMQTDFSSYSFTDTQTRDAIREVFRKSGYICDPHGAVGYLGLKEYGLKANEYGIFLETAHPVKFLDTVEETLNQKVTIPPQIQQLMDKGKMFTDISSYSELKEFLLS